VSGNEIASVDNFGRLKLWRYPCHSENPGCLTYRGHSLQGGNVAWATEDQHLISVGAKDRCVFQWKYQKEDNLDSGDEAGDSGDDSELEMDCGFGGGSAKVLEGGVFAEPYVGIKPWNKSIVPPSSLEMENVERPEYNLELDYVHGCRIEDVRSSLKFNAQGEIMYPAAALGVIYRPSDHSQQFCVGHKNDVICLQVSACGRFVATGDLGEDVEVKVWDALTGRLIVTMEKAHKKGVSQLAFSPDGRYVRMRPSRQRKRERVRTKGAQELSSDLGGTCRGRGERERRTRRAQAASEASASLNEASASREPGERKPRAR
jgi:microtubule-associated protein-like 6